MREPRALMASTAAFSSSWRDSNCTVRAGNHRNRKTIKIKAVEIRVEAFLEFILTTTMASDLASRARTVLVSSSAA